MSGEQKCAPDEPVMEPYYKLMNEKQKQVMREWIRETEYLLRRYLRIMTKWEAGEMTEREVCKAMKMSRREVRQFREIYRKGREEVQQSSSTSPWVRYLRGVYRLDR